MRLGIAGPPGAGKSSFIEVRKRSSPPYESCRCYCCCSRGFRLFFQRGLTVTHADRVDMTLAVLIWCRPFYPVFAAEPAACGMARYAFCGKGARKEPHRRRQPSGGYFDRSLQRSHRWFHTGRQDTDARAVSRPEVGVGSGCSSSISSRDHHVLRVRPRLSVRLSLCCCCFMVRQRVYSFCVVDIV